MRLVAATRILNEDDIIEAFARHHRGLVDHHVFLDNGSHDRSCEILRLLKDEGLPISLLRVNSVWSEETNHLTILHRYAAAVLGADWVVHLDADEFLDTEHSGQGFRDRLSELSAETNAFRLRVVNYPELPSKDEQDLIIPKRLLYRISVEPENFKVVVRGGDIAGRITIDAGVHKAWFDTVVIDAAIETEFRLAHYGRRSAWQQIAKFTIGRLKALAAGKTVLDAGHGLHYVALFELLRDRPQDLFHFPSFMEGSYLDGGLTRDPLAYLGGDLRYTIDEDPKLKAVRCLTAYVEDLARQHGRLIDENTAIRALMQNWLSQIELVF